MGACASPTFPARSPTDRAKRDAAITHQSQALAKGEHSREPLSVCGLILAGGQGSRMGGADKAWLEIGGMPLVAHVLRDLQAQVSHVVVSANRNLERYATLGLKPLPDLRTTSCGPLASLEAGRMAVETDLVQLVAVDTCAIAPDLVATLMRALIQAQADIAVPVVESRTASDEIGERPQWLHALLKREVLDAVGAYLDRGGRKVEGFFEASGFRITRVAFSQPQAPQWFRNINTPDDLAHAA